MKWLIDQVPVATSPSAISSMLRTTASGSSGFGAAAWNSISAIICSSPARAAQRASTRASDSRPTTACRYETICVAATITAAIATDQT
ncbi:MAG: hypothetical protein ACKOQW_07640, partial [Phycisphaerales bacterium]